MGIGTRRPRTNAQGAGRMTDEFLLLMDKLEQIERRLPKDDADEWLTVEDFERITKLNRQWFYKHWQDEMADFVVKPPDSTLLRISAKGLYRWMASREN